MVPTGFSVAECDSVLLLPAVSGGVVYAKEPYAYAFLEAGAQAMLVIRRGAHAGVSRG